MPRGREQQHYKLVLLGDASVGKSCLVARFAKDEFFENQEPTIGAAYMTQTVELDNPQKTIVKFQIWDTAGQERYRSLAPMYYRGAAAAVIVYDVTSKDTFEGAMSWVSELQGIHNPGPPGEDGGGGELVIALCGNKIDLLDSDFPREVEVDDAKDYAKENSILFFETSARTGHNVQEVFKEIARRLPTKDQQKDGTKGEKLLSDTPAATSSMSNCCGYGGGG